MECQTIWKYHQLVGLDDDKFQEVMKKIGNGYMKKEFKVVGTCIWEVNCKKMKTMNHSKLFIKLWTRLTFGDLLIIITFLSEMASSRNKEMKKWNWRNEEHNYSLNLFLSMWKKWIKKIYEQHTKSLNCSWSYILDVAFDPVMNDALRPEYWYNHD